MRSTSNYLVFGIISLALTACVTTREQLNAEKGIGTTPAPASSGAPTTGDVKSEDISPKPATPEAVHSPSANYAAANSGASTTPDAKSAPMTAPTVVTPTNSATGGIASIAVPPVVAATPRPDLSSYSAEELRAEVAQLSGKLEETEHNQQLTEQAHAEEAKKAQTRIDELEKKLKELQPDAVAVPEGKTPFEAGKDDYIANNYDEAIVFLSQAIAKSDTG